MSTRLAKQLVYGTFYGLICLAVVVGIYYFFIKPAITLAPCTGPACGSESALPLATSTITTFSTGSGSATYLAKVTDVNADFGATSFDYAFDFYNASGTVIEEISATSFIYPNQVKYLVAPNMKPVTAAYLSLNVSNVQWAASSSMGVVPRFAFSNVTTKTGSSTISLNGQITNNDVASFNAVLVVAIFKDASGDPIGASRTEIDNVAPGVAEGFSVIYPAVAGINPADNELEAYGMRNGL